MKSSTPYFIHYLSQHHPVVFYNNLQKTLLNSTFMIHSLSNIISIKYFNCSMLPIVDYSYIHIKCSGFYKTTENF